MKVYYCWRCKRDLPFLDEQEWTEIEPTLAIGKAPIVQHRREHGSTLAEARAATRSPAMDTFLALTGVDGLHVDTISHHRLSLWGPECSACGHLLRTPAASFCAHCGHHVGEQSPP